MNREYLLKDIACNKNLNAMFVDEQVFKRHFNIKIQWNKQSDTIFFLSHSFIKILNIISNNKNRKIYLNNQDLSVLEEA